jgi:hypothetical protein
MAMVAVKICRTHHNAFVAQSVAGSKLEQCTAMEGFPRGRHIEGLARTIYYLSRLRAARVFCNSFFFSASTVG